MAAQEFENLGLGDDSESISVDSSQDVLRASVAMISQTRRTLEIVSRHLDPPIYDTADFITSLQRLVLDSRRARIRIIIMNSAPVVSRGHRLIELAQRLSSYIEIRNPSRTHVNYNSAFLLADGIGSVHRILADRFEGVVNFNDLRVAQALREQFEEMWPAGTPDPNFRRLGI